MSKRSYSDREKAEAVCYVYGIRAKEASEFFYVGSTKHAPEYRLKQHLDYVRLGHNQNKHFASKLKKIGFENVVVEVIEETAESVRFDREYHWIQHFRRNGVMLTNLVIRGDQYADVVRQNEYIERVSSPAFVRQAILTFPDEPGQAEDPRNQKLVEMLHAVGKKMFDHLLTNHRDWFLDYIVSDLVEQAHIT